jgi:hypothetical protein
MGTNFKLEAEFKIFATIIKTDSSNFGSKVSKFKDLHISNTFFRG